jgi:hypothetical protein
VLDRWGYIEETLRQRRITPSLARFRQEVIASGARRLDVSCYNQILFLLNAERMPEGTRFVSDHNVFDVLMAVTHDSMEEFSGLLSITLPAPATRTLNIEFVQILL